jgi:hypothetical protein
MASDAHIPGARPCAPSIVRSATLPPVSQLDADPASFRAAADRFYRACADAEAADRTDAEASDATSRELDAAPCASWRELAEAWEIATEQGEMTPGTVTTKLLADRRRLAAAEDIANAIDPFGRAEFARAWLRLFTHKGGDVLQDDDGKFWLGQAEYWDSPQRQDDDAELHAQPTFAGLSSVAAADVEKRHRAFCDAAYVGAMRALVDMLDAMPGGRDAVKALVLLNPHAGRARQKHAAAASDVEPRA